jgi:ketosteroid isomerase-like protein
MHSNHALIETFYQAFNRGDHQTMADCYHPDISFHDPVFLNLEGPQVAQMWEMLCRQASSLEVAVQDIAVDDKTGVATWTARYLFGKEKRQVVNHIKASFRFQDGKIIQHVDAFNFWRWSRMALGPLGSILGWHNSVKKKIREQALRNLTQFIESKKAV